jgi:hypothetical protein
MANARPTATTTARYWMILLCEWLPPKLNVLDGGLGPREGRNGRGLKQ